MSGLLAHSFTTMAFTFFLVQTFHSELQSHKRHRSANCAQFSNKVRYSLGDKVKGTRNGHSARREGKTKAINNSLVRTHRLKYPLSYRLKGNAMANRVMRPPARLML